MFKKTLVASAIGFSAMASSAAEVTLLSEGFDNVAALNGWLISNQSNPVGDIAGWFQGGAIFNGQAGGLGSYIGSNYAVAADVPGGIVDSWLLTPSFSTAARGTVSFWVRADTGPSGSLTDQFRFGLNQGSTDLTSFALSPLITAAGDWTQYTIPFASAGSGSQARLAIEYFGSAATSNYIGVDSVLITAVPEPSTYALTGIGLFGVVLARRRKLAERAVG